jgi:hypothetical protein
MPASFVRPNSPSNADKDRAGRAVPVRTVQHKSGVWQTIKRIANPDDGSESPWSEDDLKRFTHVCTAQVEATQLTKYKPIVEATTIALGHPAFCNQKIKLSKDKARGVWIVSPAHIHHRDFHPSGAIGGRAVQKELFKATAAQSTMFRYATNSSADPTTPISRDEASLCAQAKWMIYSPSPVTMSTFRGQNTFFAAMLRARDLPGEVTPILTLERLNTQVTAENEIRIVLQRYMIAKKLVAAKGNAPGQGHNDGSTINNGVKAEAGTVQWVDLDWEDNGINHGVAFYVAKGPVVGDGDPTKKSTLQAQQYDDYFIQEFGIPRAAFVSSFKVDRAALAVAAALNHTMRRSCAGPPQGTSNGQKTKRR